MSKKHKNKIKNRRKYAERTKRSNKRKQEAQNELQQLGLDLNCDTLSIGIVFEDLSIAQTTFFCINEINVLCEKYVGLNMQLFVQHSLQACVQPLCPIDNVTNLVSWKHPLIATNVSTCLDALTSPSNIIYHYVSDADFTQQYHISTSDLIRAFCDPRVHVITRHNDYKQLIEREFEVQTKPIVVQNFRMIDIIKEIVSEMHNAKQTTI